MCLYVFSVYVFTCTGIAHTRAVVCMFFRVCMCVHARAKRIHERLCGYMHGQRAYTRDCVCVCLYIHANTLIVCGCMCVWVHVRVCACMSVHALASLGHVCCRMKKRASSVSAEKRVASSVCVDDKSDVGSEFFEDDFEDEFEHEDIVDAEFENVEWDGGEHEQVAHVPAPRVFRPGVDEVDPDHVLEPEAGIYKMLHRMDVQWPCLSFDVLADALGASRTKFPLTSYVVAGTQADVSEKNKLIVMKWSNLQRTNRDGLDDEEEGYKLEDDEDEDDDEGNNDEDPELEFKMIKHPGGVNRVRAMPQMSALVSTWSDEGTVHVWNIHSELEALEGRGVAAGGKPVHTFSGHESEGFAMGWNPHQVGQLITGDSTGTSFLWSPDTAGTWSQEICSVWRDNGAVEDIEFRRIGCVNTFALCGGVGGKVGIMDTRNLKKIATEFVAHDGDTNVLSWNPIVGQLLLTGGDDGTFKVWDVRATGRGALANFKWHRGPVTSVDWHPTDEAVLAVSSADDTTSIWDMSVEEDTNETSNDDENYFPPQLLFLHMGQKSVKEIKFHKQLPGVIVSTAFDGFNIFKTFNIN